MEIFSSSPSPLRLGRTQDLVWNGILVVWQVALHPSPVLPLSPHLLVLTATQSEAVSTLIPKMLYSLSILKLLELEHWPSLGWMLKMMLHAHTTLFRFLPGKTTNTRSLLSELHGSHGLYLRHSNNINSVAGSVELVSQLRSIFRQVWPWWRLEVIAVLQGLALPSPGLKS